MISVICLKCGEEMYFETCAMVISSNFIDGSTYTCPSCGMQVEVIHDGD